MPYRRLPNTDQARLRALKTALDKGMQMPPSQLAFSQKLLLNIRSLVPKYEQAIEQYLFSRERQSKGGKVLTGHFKSARMYVSHFLQVLNMGIARREFKPEVRRYYGLSVDDKSVPEISTEQQLIDLGHQTIKGEEQRIVRGGTRLFNPSIAKVKVHFEKFMESYYAHKDMQETTHKMVAKVAQRREEADGLILDLWNQTEAAFEHLPANLKREMCSTYGVVYVYRPSEKESNDTVI